MANGRCSKCGDPVRNAPRAGYCDPCNRAYGRENYRQNKARYFAQARARDAELDLLILRRKCVPCTDCGVEYPPVAMDFDHLDTDKKEHDISKMRRRKMAFEKIVAEMDKCDVVCANCHRIRTNERNPSPRYARALEALAAERGAMTELKEAA